MWSESRDSKPRAILYAVSCSKFNFAILSVCTDYPDEIGIPIDPKIN